MFIPVIRNKSPASSNILVKIYIQRLSMVCASVQEDNPRGLESGLSPVHMQNHTITYLSHQFASDVKH